MQRSLGIIRPITKPSKIVHVLITELLCRFKRRLRPGPALAVEDKLRAAVGDLFLQFAFDLVYYNVLSISLQIPLDCFARIRIGIRSAIGLAMTAGRYVTACSRVIARANDLESHACTRRLQSS